MSEPALLDAPPTPIDLPTTPPGWETESARLIRIIAPEGRAAAWLAPTYGANCVGYAVRRPEGWMHIFAVEPPQSLKARPTRSGCAVLFPFPGHVRGARYLWDGVEYLLPPNAAGKHYTHGFAQFHPWRVAHITASAVEAEFVAQALLDGQPTGYPFAVQLHLNMHLSATSLTIALTATNTGARPAPVGLGLHPYFSPELFGGDRSTLRISLPGTLEHVLDESIPTGARHAVIDQEIAPPPDGQSLMIARTDLGAYPVAHIRGQHTSPRVSLATFGCRDLLFYAPDDRPSIALEPHTCAPGAASQPAGHPDGLVGLAPGATMQLTMRVSVDEN